MNSCAVLLRSITFVPMEAIMTPATILRTVRHMETKGNKTKVSVAYIANFQDGSTKSWCDHAWINNSLLWEKDSHGFEEYMDRNSCPMFYRDWSHIQYAAKGKKNRPKVILK